jgi:pimeloyl-ACP methyl ester carboxylesterase
LSPPWTILLFPGARPLVYVSSLAGKKCASQWSIYHGVGEDGLHEIEFLAEIDPAASGAGGSLIRQRSRLWCTDTVEPVRYTTQAQGTRLALHFAPDSVNVELPDGSVQSVARDGAAFLIDGNIPGQAALVYAACADRLLSQQAARLRLFLASQLVTAPCEISLDHGLCSSSGRWYRTSHREEILLDADGLMCEARIPHLGSDCKLESSGPPLPDWPEDLAPAAPPLRYAPAKTARFRLEDVSIAGPVTPIGAALTGPDETAPLAGVLFLSGSGTHDRHGICGEIDIGTHEIMDSLAEQGFLGLRFDTRGAGTTRLGADALDRGLTSDIADARACFTFLRERSELAGRPLFLVGHSQGGMEALALANDHDVAASLAGVVLMATPGRDLDVLLADQVVTHGEEIGFSREQIGRQLDDLREATRLVRSGRPWQPGEIPDYLLAVFRTRTWYEEMLRCRTPDLIARVRCPVLVCQGGKDFQISPTLDAEALVAAARNAGVECDYALFPELDHLFKPSSARSTLAEYYEPRAVDPAFIAGLAAWLTQRVSVIGAGHRPTGS